MVALGRHVCITNILTKSGSPIAKPSEGDSKRPSANRDKSRSKSKSPEIASIQEAAAEDDDHHENGGGGGDGAGHDVGDFVNDPEMASSSSSLAPQQLERWTSSNSLTGQNK